MMCVSTTTTSGFLLFVISLELCSGSTVWRPRAGTAHPLAHLIPVLRELSHASVLQLRKWIIELLVPRVTFIHLYIPQGIIECLLCAEASV